jgi:hypothetical protein
MVPEPGEAKEKIAEYVVPFSKVVNSIPISDDHDIPE